MRGETTDFVEKEVNRKNFPKLNGIQRCSRCTSNKKSKSHHSSTIIDSISFSLDHGVSTRDREREKGEEEKENKPGTRFINELHFHSPLRSILLKNVERIILLLYIGKEHLCVCRAMMEKKEAIADDRVRSPTNKHIHSSTLSTNGWIRISHKR